MIAEFPLLVFTVLTGLAAGSYVMATIYAALDKEQKRSWMFSGICLVLLGVGMLASLLHLGHPERFLNALSNPTSMITLEAYCALPFGIFVLIDAVMLKFDKNKNLAIPIIAAVCGLALMLVTSNLYFSAHRYEAWAQPLTWLVFLGGDLAMGAFAVLAFCKKDVKPFGAIALVLGYLMTVVFAVEAYVFGSAGYGFVLFIVAAICSLGATILLHLKKMGKLDQSYMLWLTFALQLIAVILARYAFYSIV